jgi:transcriptional regulator with GAF, ATPase, and Fis domain/tetratricopeptide (TPR) repeat protein/predicted Ser/Thr protein kinase
MRVAGHHVIRSLGTGATGRVFLVEVRGARRALKILHADERGQRAGKALRIEFDVLRELVHPNLVRVIDIGRTENGETWFTAEYVPGSNFEEVLPGLDRPALVSVIAQILRALGFIHRRGFVHFDLHPGNIRVTPDGRVKLLDFGLAGRPGRRLAGLRGTWPYVAPEVLDGDVVGRRADLFSLGVALACGLGIEVTVEPPAAFRLAPDDAGRLPPELRRLVPRLLELNPDLRYRRARDALRDLSAAAGRTLPEETAETLLAHVQFAPFVGREVELGSALRPLWNLTEGRGDERTPRILLVEGERGVGKSRLLREMAHRAAARGVRVIRARCREGMEGAYDPVPELLAGLVESLGTQHEDLIDRHADALAVVVPELVPPSNDAPASSGDRAGLLTSLGDFVMRAASSASAGTEPYPVLVIVEDIHLAGGFLIAFLEVLLRDLLAAEHEVPPILIAATLREESPRADTVRAGLVGGPRTRVIALRRFTRDEVASLLKGMLGIAPGARFVDELHEKTGGNAYFIEELLERMIEVGGLSLRDGDWHVVESRAFRVPDSVRQLLRARLLGLSPLQMEILRTLAVFGEPIPAEILGVLVPDADRPEDVQNLVERRILIEAPGGAVDFHDALAEDIVLATIPPAELARRHGAVGRLLLERGRPWLDRANHHFSLGDDAPRGLRSSLRAAIRLRRRGAEDRAVEYLERALGFVTGENSARMRTRILAGIGDMQRLRGKLPRAEQSYRAALAEERSASVGADLRRRLGEVLLARGAYDEALSCCRKARRGLGEAERLTRVRLHALEGMIHHRRGHHTPAIEAVRRGLESLDGETRLEGAQLMSLMGNVMAEMGDLDKATSFHEKSLQVCRAMDYRDGVARSHHNLGVVHASLGDPYRSARYYREALRILDDLGRLQAVALTLNNLGNLLAERGDLDESEHHHRRALRLRRHVGDTLGIAMSVGNLGSLDRLRGRWGRAFLGCRRAVLSFRRLGSVYGEALFLANQAELLLDVGDLERASELAERALDLSRHNQLRRIEARVHLLLAERDRLAHDPLSAARRASKSFDLAQRIGYKVCAAEADLTRARLAVESGRPDRARIYLERARLVARERRVGGLLVHHLRMTGVVLCLDPDTDQEEAAPHLEQALARARELKRPGDVLDISTWLTAVQIAEGATSSARAHLEEARRTAGEIARSLPRRMRTVFLEDSRRRWLDRLEARLDEDAPEGEEMDETALKLIEVNKRINSETDLRRLLDFIMDTAIDITGAERGFLILAEGKKVAFQVARNIKRRDVDSPEREISRRLVTRVVKTGEAILTDNASEDPRFEEYVSVSDLNLTSILTVPFKAEDRTLGAIYLDNRFRKGAFTEDDLQVLTGIGGLAAISIERLRQQEEITRLNLQLKERLERKTDELHQARQVIEGRPTKYDYKSIIGGSGPMKQVFLILDKVVESDVPVLIQGESGTGKELVARAMHTNGARSSKPFIAVNCGAIPINLLESEFFGHVRGAFTGAVEDKKGLFVHADGGTLFLDEIGDMDLEMQKKLLRVLQEGELRPVGGKRQTKVDVRIISATNKNLTEEMKARRFREDLYYRVNVINIDLPPLRERPDDIGPLIQHFLEKTADELGIEKKGVDDDVLTLLGGYAWPGNIRELENEVKRATALSDERITRDDLSPQILEGAAVGDPGKESGTLKAKVEQAEKVEIQRALEEAKGNQTRAAKALGISRVWLRKKMERYGLLK